MSIVEVICVMHRVVEVVGISVRGDVESRPARDCEPYKLSSINNLEVKEIAAPSKVVYRYS